MAHEFLSVYLNDHLAGSQVALELLDILNRVDRSNVWTDLKREIRADRGELEALMHTTGATESALRSATAWAGEKLAELKMHVDDPSRGGELRRLELIEALALGIDGKRALWTALQTASTTTSALEQLDYARLIARAESQRQVVEQRRLSAAGDALRPRAAS